MTELKDSQAGEHDHMPEGWSCPHHSSDRSTCDISTSHPMHTFHLQPFSLQSCNLSYLTPVNWCVCVCVLTQCCPILCDPVDCTVRLLCPWDSPGQNTGVGCHSLLQGIFPTLGWKPCVFCGSCSGRQIPYH